MTPDLNCLIRQYERAKSVMQNAIEADETTFNAAVKLCRELRKQIEDNNQDEHAVDLFDWK